MTKVAGMGDMFLVDEFNLSGDTQALGTVGGGPAALDITGIDKSAYERIGGLRDGRIEWTSFFNDAAGAAHPALKDLPTGDTVVSYLRGTTLGNDACSMLSKQINYDGTRANDGMFTFNIQAQCTGGQGLAWGELLTTGGLVTHSGGTTGTSVDHGAASGAADTGLPGGLRGILHVTAFTGTSITVNIQQSSDNGSGDAFASVLAFSAASAVGAQVVEVTGAIERYLRIVSTGTFSSATIAVIACRLGADV